mmetsp:Transcript_13990/g.30283  ORF Transcript_13990/g.30283 Transcript_13990/m.30283 type:complete len:969 (+) Transcript_13990:1-2907(+)
MRTICGLAAVAAALRLSRSGGVVGGEEDVVLRQPKSDPRTYKYTTLANGLKVLAVEDPTATKSGFAMAVEAGSFDDPEELPGLAHFVEHMLFLGTEKYPHESDYDNFLNKHDGKNNAFTAQEKTVYFNEIATDALDEGLDRFAQFFIAPLFTASAADREVNAVNSEHLKNIPDQFRKTWSLLRSLAKPGSPVHKFYTGNLESLKLIPEKKGIKNVEAMKQLHKDHYCSDRMHLVIFSKLNVTQQLRMAESHFSDVKKGSCVPKKDYAAVAPFDASNVGQLIRMGTSSAPQLWMMFSLPAVSKAYRAQPKSYLSYVLGYNGAHSLKSTLKKKDLATNVNFQIDDTSARTLLFVIFSLTPQGAQDENAVAAEFFRYINAVKQSDVNMDLYKSLQGYAAMDFDFREAQDSVMDTVSSLADSMTSFEPRDIIAGDTLVQEPNSTLVSQLLAGVTPTNMEMSLATQGFDGGSLFDKWYNVKFDKKQIPAEWVHNWASLNGGDYKSPPPLKYVPKNSFPTAPSAGEHPVVLSTDLKGIEVWWQGLGSFRKMPKASIRVKLQPTKDSASPRNTANAMMHVNLLQSTMEEQLEDLQQCGLSYAARSLNDGYQLEFDGYADFLGELVKQVTAGFSARKYDDAAFHLVKQSLIDQLSDKTSKMPFEHAMDVLKVATEVGAYSTDEILAELNSTSFTLSSFQSDMSHVMQSLRVTAFFYGDVTQDKSVSIAKDLLTMLKAKPLPKEDALETAVAKPASETVVAVRNPIQGDTNHAVISAYQFGIPTIQDRVHLVLLGMMVGPAVYDTLRTQQQLGYVVSGGVVAHLPVVELRVVVQGAKAPPQEVQQRIETLLHGFTDKLETMSPAEFATWKSGMRSTLLRKDQNIGQEVGTMWSTIYTAGTCFDKKKKELAYLAQLNSTAPLVALWKKSITSEHRDVYVVEMFNDKTALPSVNASNLAVAEAAKAKGDLYPNQYLCEL